MFKFFKKIIAILLIIGINWSAVSAVSVTMACFNDTESLGENDYIAGILDFSLDGVGVSETEFNAGDTATTTIKIINKSTIDFQYTASTTIISNSNNFCEELSLTAKLDEIELYNGNLANFLSPTTTMPTTTTSGIWDFEVSLRQNSAADGNCEFDFVFYGFQDDLSYGDGFFDNEKISNIITNGESNENLSVTNVEVNPLQYTHSGCCDSEGTPEIDCPAGRWHSAQALYYSQQLDITWNATSSNPLNNSKLLIDVVYITDNDCSGDISGGDYSYAIASSEVNDEIYTWKGWVGGWDGTLWKDEKSDEEEEGDIVPYFYGYAWIKITATSPNNSTISSFDTSIEMFEPLPPGVSIENICSISKNSCGNCCSKLKDHTKIIEKKEIKKVIETIGDLREKIDEMDEAADKKEAGKEESGIDDIDGEEASDNNKNNIDDDANKTIGDSGKIMKTEADNKKIEEDEIEEDNSEIIEEKEEKEIEIEIELGNSEIIDEEEINQIDKMEIIDEKKETTEEIKDIKEEKKIETETEKETEAEYNPNLEPESKPEPQFDSEIQAQEE